MRPKMIESSAGNAQAIILVCLGAAFLTLNDTFVKLLVERYDASLIIFVRNLLALPMIAAIGIVIVGPGVLSTSHGSLYAVRGFVQLVAAYLYLRALEFLTLAEATALIFASPIFITCAAAFFLFERIGWRRWSAVLVGFLGVVIAVQPGAETFQPASLLVLAAALLYAGYMISARWLHQRESLWTMMFYGVLFPALFVAPFALVVWAPIHQSDVPLFVAAALCGSLGIALIPQAFRLAPAGVVAPFDYTALLWAVGIGWLVWGDIPHIWTIVGALIIALSGIVIVLLEAHRTRKEIP